MDTDVTVTGSGLGSTVSVSQYSLSYNPFS